MSWWFKRKPLFIVREADGCAEIMRFYIDNASKVTKILKRRYRAGKLLNQHVSIHHKDQTIAILNLTYM